MYTTLLSTLISSLSLYHHLYADDTQLFLSFRPSDFQANISHLQNALTQITSWMTSVLLSLHSSHNSSTSIDTTQSARNLGFIFDEHLSFSDLISALSKSSHSCSPLYPSLPWPSHRKKQLPPPLYTPSLTTVTLFRKVYGHFGPKTLRTQDISALCVWCRNVLHFALVPKCPMDTSAPVPKCLGKFGTKVYETLRTQN